MDTGKSTGSSSIEFQHGLYLDQAKLANLEQEQGEIKDQLAQVIQTLQELVIIQTQNQPQPQARARAPYRHEVVESESEASSQDESLEYDSEEEEQP